MNPIFQRTSQCVIIFIIIITALITTAAGTVGISSGEETLGFLPYWEATGYQPKYDYLTHIAWFTVDVNSDGKISNGHTPSWPPDQIISDAHSHVPKVNVLLTATNHDSIQLDSILANYKEDVATNLLTLVKSGNGDGIIINFENIAEINSENGEYNRILLVQFMKELSDTFITENYYVSITLPSVDWNHVYDLNELSPYVDSFFIMGYDYHLGSGHAGSNSPFLDGISPSISNTLDNYLSQIDSNKLILGLPFYGWDWETEDGNKNSNYITGSTPEAVTIGDITKNAANHEYLWVDSTQWNSSTKTLWRVYKDGETWHQVWFENPYSLGLKYDLVENKRLRGVGYWALGFEGDNLDVYDKNYPKFLTSPLKSSLNPTVKNGWYYSHPPNSIGIRHSGIDYEASYDEEIIAAADGVAMSSSQYAGGTGYGKFVLIKHEEKDENGNNFFTLYAHINRPADNIKIYPQDQRSNTNYADWTPEIKRGDVIGYVGHEDTSWDHLHFEVLRGGYAQRKTDPYDIYMPTTSTFSSADFYPPTGNLYTSNGINSLWVEDKKLDLIFLIDTTGSMGDDIENVKSSAHEIVDTLDLKGYDYRVAIADYKDYPCCGYGGWLDYVYKLDLPFKNKDNKEDIISAIYSLSASGGADWRESVYSALVKAMKDENKDLNNADNYGWRKGVTKAIILMGDAPPHDPEPWFLGYSLDDVSYWSENIDPVIVYSIAVGSDPTTYASFSEISEKTGGKVYTSPTASDIVDAIIEAIGDIGESETYGVSVNINPTINEANPGQSVTYSIDVTNTGTIADTYDISIDIHTYTV